MGNGKGRTGEGPEYLQLSSHRLHRGTFLRIVSVHTLKCFQSEKAGMTAIIQTLPDLNTVIDLLRTPLGTIGSVVMLAIIFATVIARDRKEEADDVLFRWIMGSVSKALYLGIMLVQGLGTGLGVIVSRASRLKQWVAENMEVNITISITPRSIAAALVFFLGLVGAADITGWIDILPIVI